MSTIQKHERGDGARGFANGVQREQFVVLGWLISRQHRLNHYYIRMRRKSRRIYCFLSRRKKLATNKVWSCKIARLIECVVPATAIKLNKYRAVARSFLNPNKIRLLAGHDLIYWPIYIYTANTPQLYCVVKALQELLAIYIRRIATHSRTGRGGERRMSTDGSPLRPDDGIHCIVWMPSIR